MARVIFWVDWTERILRRMSLRVAIPSSDSGGLDAPAHRELGLGLVDRLREAVAQLVSQLFLVRDLGQELAVLPVQERVEELLERLDLLHRKIVEQPLGPGEDDRDLPLYGLGDV